MLTWRKSSYSTNGGECVEVAVDRPEVLVRDTKDRAGGTLTASPSAWRELLSRLR
ncbi:DUF397 domain-containing protein [Amycolatopsis sp. OK19-0408]|uniref:DUF397 domain-containing protein n=1 Tax=Amycolatopsis iheyensis TaxID=2945988 RepID=A0A9X2NIE8_9PSEU|nr:DUF397 domain-containing protein [Amycolatopsis iheyensis]MCR6487249.1 DUF397 domain-containing protein [Amycolatopsis iheyensis]